MSDQEKGSLIGAIIGQLRLAAQAKNRPFDGGDVFFSLAFKSDSELNKIAKLCGVAKI